MTMATVIMTAGERNNNTMQTSIKLYISTTPRIELMGVSNSKHYLYILSSGICAGDVDLLRPFVVVASSHRRRPSRRFTPIFAAPVAPGAPPRQVIWIRLDCGKAVWIGLDWITTNLHSSGPAKIYLDIALQYAYHIGNH